MSIQKAAYEAIQAVNKIETLPGAQPAQRLVAMLQLQRHIDGLVQKMKAAAPANPVSQTTGD